MTKDECITGINLLKKSIPKIDIDASAAYYMLSELDFNMFMYAIKSIVLDHNFKLYDNVIGEIWHRAKNHNKLTREEAWELVLKKIREHGYLKEPEFSDFNIPRSISNAGGWHKICSSQSIEWDKKRFLEAYAEFTEKSNQEDMNIQICLDTSSLPQIGNVD